MISDIKKRQKTPNMFECEICDFSCRKESEWGRHKMTGKHINRINRIEKTPKTPKTSKMYICECGKEYKYSRGLWEHKKKCSVEQPSEISNNNNISITDIDKEILVKMLLKNQDIMEGVILKNSDVMDKMMEIMPNMGMNNYHNTNSHNTTNNQFNIQMFLNDHCKNAMNLTDFIQSLPITAETYDNTIENGLTKTITTMITNGLSQLDILERPIHCTDATRKTLYVKDEDIWEKDTELIKMLLGIKTLARKQRNMIHEWKDANKGWEKDEIIQMKFTNLICNSMTDIENDVKETGKIIRTISKQVYLDNEAKHQYIQ
jgi:hypothetical protein